MNYGNFAKEHGAIGTDGRFAIFPDMETGNRAAEALLKTPGYQNAPAVPSQGFNQGSVGAAIYRWAPPSENNSASYAKFVAEKTGLDVNTPMSELSDAQISKVREAISYYEGHNSPTTVIGDSFNGSTNFADFKEKAINQTALNKAALKSGTSLKYNISSNMAKDVKNFVENDANFEQNVLDYYDNVTYRIRLWFLPEKSLREFYNLDTSQQQNYSGEKIMIYDSASTTTLSVDDITIDTKVAPNGSTKKVFTVGIDFTIFEPNGCSFLDDYKWNILKAGYYDHINTPLFLEVSFVGYHNITDKNNPMGPDIISKNGYEEKRVFTIVPTAAGISVSNTGATYKFETKSIETAVAFSKDYFNFTKKIEINSGCVDLQSFIMRIQESLNESSYENILENIAEEMDEPIYSFDITGVENERIDFNVLANSGESAGKSSKYVIEPGTSIEKVLDDLTASLECNKKLSVSDDDIVINSDEWPVVYRFEPDVKYKGQTSRTKQKMFKITYRIKEYVPTNLKTSQPSDKNKQTQEVYTLINRLEAPIEKKYDYVFTSKNSQVLKFKANLDMAYFVNTYKNLAVRNKDDSGMVTNSLSINENLNTRQALTLDDNTMNTMNTINLLYTNNETNKNKNDYGININSLELSETILEKADIKPYLFTGLDIPILPATNNLYESKMNKDATAQNDVKAVSSFAQLYDTNALIRLTLTIRGDPYWLCNPHLMKLNTDSNFIWNMKTPKRLQSGEMMDISQDFRQVQSLWGVYMAITIKHMFKKGVFTQEIFGIANPNFRFPI